MTHRLKTTRIRAGEYEVRGFDTRVVSVSRYTDDGVYWIAAARWNRHQHSHPVPTKREAFYYAQAMLGHPVPRETTT